MAQYRAVPRKAVVVAPVEEAAVEEDLSALKKAELIELAEERELDTSGTKADIIERIETAGG
jgi:hypothetical protein